MPIENLDPRAIPEPHPFSTIITWKIITLIRERDLKLADLHKRYATQQITRDEMANALQESEDEISDQILEVCKTNIKSLEDTVNNVLEIQRQLQEIRGFTGAPVKG